METALVEHSHPAAARVVRRDAAIQRIAGGFGFTEGPIWLGDRLLFSDIPNSRIVQYRPLAEGPEITSYRTPSGNSNGLTLDRAGRLVACEHSGRRVSRQEADGALIAIADRYEGKRLNSPNDVVVRSDGLIFFTDPPYGLGEPNHSRGKELDFNGVYTLDQAGRLRLVCDDFEKPNGLAFSPDERTLYVDDTDRYHIRRFQVASDGTLSGGQVFVTMTGDEPGGPDGMKVDTEGNVYCTGRGGVWIIAPDATVLGRIVLPELPANVAWGDSDWRTLYITARTSVYRVRVEVPGIAVR